MDALIQSDMEAAHALGMLDPALYNSNSGSLEAPISLSKAIAALRKAGALRWIEDARLSEPQWEYCPEASSETMAGIRCPGIIIGWAEHIDIQAGAAESDRGRGRGGGSGNTDSGSGAGRVKRLRELKLDDLLRLDKTTALQRHPGLTRHDRLLEVSYREPMMSSCPGCTESDRIEFVKVRLNVTMKEGKGLMGGAPEMHALVHLPCSSPLFIALVHLWIYC